MLVKGGTDDRHIDEWKERQFCFTGFQWRGFPFMDRMTLLKIADEMWRNIVVGFSAVVILGGGWLQSPASNGRPWFCNTFSGPTTQAMADDDGGGVMIRQWLMTMMVVVMMMIIISSSSSSSNNNNSTSSWSSIIIIIITIIITIISNLVKTYAPRNGFLKPIFYQSKQFWTVVACICLHTMSYSVFTVRVQTITMTS